VIFPTDPDELAIALQRLRAQPTAIPDIATALGRPRQWVETLYSLSIPDFRRALRSVPPTLSRLPYEKLYPTTGWLGDYLLYCQEMEAPLGWHFWCGVVLLGLVARRNFYIDRGVYFLYLNHYVLILGPSGLTKSTTIDRIMAVFRGVQLAAGGDMGVDHIYQSPERITAQRLLQDLTKWTATHDSRRDTILFMVNDELATLAGKNVKGSDVLIDFLTAVYAKDSYKDSTIVGGNRELVNAATSCLFGTTPSSMRRNIIEALFTDGFMGRTITASRQYSERHGIYSRPPPIDPVMGRMLSQSLVPWLLINRELEVRPTPEAELWMDEWYDAHTRAMPNEEKLIAFWKRKQDHMFKLAGVLALSEAIAGGPERLGEALWVELPTMQLALQMLEAEEARLPDAFAMIGAKEESQDTARIQQYIEKKFAESGEPVLHTRIFHNCRHIVKSGQHLREMTEALMGMDVIQEVAVGGKMAYKPKGAK